MKHQLRRRRLLFASIALALVAPTIQIAAQQPPVPARRPSSVSRPGTPLRQIGGSTTPSQVPLKGIFEPISYPDDLQLFDVFFVNRNIGWAVGGKNRAGGVALYTSDGGNHWAIQVGDPQSNAAPFSHLRFVDERHGWMVQGNDQLLRTVDGQNWEVVSKIPDYYFDYLFTSPTTGVMSSSGRIQRTVDGGRTWKPVFTCRISLQTNGLTQDVECTPQSLHFPSPQVGYFVAYFGSSTILGKTMDGGKSWRVSLALPTEGGKEGELFFQDENTGFLRIGNGNVYATSDGAQSWHQLPGVYIGGRPEMKFADPEVGWSIVYRTMAFTTDGHRWTSRDLGFPANVNAFSLPTRDRGYVVGDHGMIFRYRVVPANYTAQGAIDAPLMPAYGGPLRDDLDRMRAEVAVLRTKLGVPGPNAQQTASPTGAVPSASQRSSLPGYDMAQSSPLQGDPGGFVQDMSDVPMSPAVQTCCASEIQTFQNDFGSFAQQVPSFSGKFRNLNLVVVGLNMLSDLMNRAHGMRDSFVALKRAPSLSVASLALQQLAGTLENTAQTVNTGFSSGPGLAGFSDGMPMGVGQAASPFSGDPSSSAPAPTTDQSFSQDSNSSMVSDPGGAAQELANKVKSKLPKIKFPH